MKLLSVPPPGGKGQCPDLFYGSVSISLEYLPHVPFLSVQLILSTLLRCTEDLKGGGLEETSVTNQSPPSWGNLRVTSPHDHQLLPP